MSEELKKQFARIKSTALAVRLDGSDPYDNRRTAELALSHSKVLKPLADEGITVILDDEGSLIVQKLSLCYEADIPTSVLMDVVRDDNVDDVLRLVHFLLAWNRYQHLHDNWLLGVEDQRQNFFADYEPKPKDLHVIWSCRGYLFERISAGLEEPNPDLEQECFGVCESLLWQLMNNDEVRSLVRAEESLEGCDVHWDIKAQLEYLVESVGSSADAQDMSYEVLMLASSDDDVLEYVRGRRGVDDVAAAAERRIARTATNSE